VFAEDGNVIEPLPQGRQPKREYGQPEIEILTEAPVLDLFLEVFVRGGDDADVDGMVFVPPPS